MAADHTPLLCARGQNEVKPAQAGDMGMQP